METQAQGSPQGQTQAPVHPIHQETQTLQALEQWVKTNPDNDPHQGTELEAPVAPAVPASPVETPTETTQEAAPEGETVEIDEETPFFDLEYNGKTEKLSAKQIREGYLAKQDYHRNIQKVKADEASIQDRVKAAELQAIQQYVQRVETFQQAVQRLSNVKPMAEIEALAKTDPATAQQEFLRLINVNQTFQALEQEKQAALGKQQQAMHSARQQAVVKAREQLEADIPNWNADLYNKVLDTVSKDYGFPANEVEQVLDARLIKVFHDAYQHRQLEKAKPGLNKKVSAVPKVLKPGSAEKPSPTEANKELETQFRKSGDWRDAAQLYLARSKKR